MGKYYKKTNMDRLFIISLHGYSAVLKNYSGKKEEEREGKGNLEDWKKRERKRERRKIMSCFM